MANFDILNAFSLLVLLWNCHSIVSNLIEFNKFIYDSKPHIVCICETWLNPSDNLKVQGYRVFRKDRVGRGGGIAILIRDSINVRDFRGFREYNNGLLEVMALQIEVQNKWCDICLFYNPGSRTVLEAEFDHYFGLFSSDSILCGDFNSHHPLWSNSIARTTASPSGNALASVYSDSPHFNLLTRSAAQHILVKLSIPNLLLT